MTRTSNPVDPLVERFLEADPAPDRQLAAIRSLPRPIGPKLEAIQLLLEVALKLRSPSALAQIEQAHQAPSSVDLHLLFLIAWYRALFFVDPNWNRATVIRDRIFSLLSPRTPPEIVGWAMLMHATTEFYSGNVAAALRAVRKLTDGISPASPHYRRLVAIRALHDLRNGLGVDPDLPRISEDSEFYRQRFFEGLLCNSSLNGNLASAPIAEWAELAQRKLTLRWMMAHEYEVVRRVLNLMGEQRSESVMIPPGEDASDEEPAWLTSTRCLLRQETEEALRWARLHVDRANPRHRTIIGFDEYTLIRAELAAGHHDAARRLLINRSERGTRHYIDDLFLARVEALTGNRELAAHHFARLLAAVEAYRAQGRVDFEMRLACELSASDLIEVTRRATKFLVQQPEGEAPWMQEHQREQATAIDRLVYSSSQMSAVHDRILSFAAHDAPVLITGETGTGKELIAQALHSTGPGASEPFTAINCGALSDSLIESELFGHERGAFTGAEGAYRGLFRETGAGTIFLDEIGEISPRLQIALLRVLETGEVRPIGGSRRHKIRCRIVAATNADLESLVKRGIFRQDLLFRLQRLEITVLALRERPEDILTLAAHFLNTDRVAGQRASMSPALGDALKASPWPGNVRELRNVIERMRVLNSDKLFYDLADFHAVLPSSSKESPAGAAGLAPAVAASSAQPTASSRSAEPDLARDQRGLETAEQIDTYLATGQSPLRRVQRLRELFGRYPQLKTTEVATIMGVSRHTAARDLGLLCREGLIEKVMPNSSPRSHYYALRSAGSRDPTGTAKR